MASTKAALKRLLAGVTLVLLTSLPPTQGHGRLMEPPSRSSMWRVGYATPVNYDDNALNCGGLNTEWYVNHGKCGVCGDPWDQAEPRDNEAGGKYGKGIITNTYNSGQVIDVRVQITANHKGWFEFRLCVHNSPTTPITHECLDQHLLELADRSGTRYTIDPTAQTVDLKVKLPDGVSCSQCVLQWKWHGGNNYGNIQEEFYGCSDIAIGTTPATTPPPTPAQPTNHPTALPTHRPTLPPATTTSNHTAFPPITTHQPTPPPTTRPHPPLITRPPTFSPPSSTKGPVGSSGTCHAVGQLQGVPDIERYCREQCPLGNCPPAYCSCSAVLLPTIPSVTKTPSPITHTPALFVPTTTTTQRVTTTTAAPKVTTPVPVTTAAPKVTTTSTRPVTTRDKKPTSSSTVSANGSGLKCHAEGLWKGVPELDLYCNEQCPLGNCPTPCVCVSGNGTNAQLPYTTSFSHSPTTTTTTGSSSSSTTSSSSTSSTTTTTSQPTTKSGTACVAIGSWQGDITKDQWCNTNCPQGLCPSLTCHCGNGVVPTTTPVQTSSTTTTNVPTPIGVGGASGNPCRAVGPWAGDALLDRWCKQTCIQFPGCDPQYCRCDTPFRPSSSPTTSLTSSSTPFPTTTPTTTSTTSTPTSKCQAINGWAGNPDLDSYCDRECRHPGGACPPEYCFCGSAVNNGASSTTTPPSTTPVACYAINGWAGNPDLDHFCNVECKAGVCPPQYCACGTTTATTTPTSTTTSPSTTTTSTTTTQPSAPTARGSGSSQPSSFSQCLAVGPWKGVPELDAWCRSECALGNCPPAYCVC